MSQRADEQTRRNATGRTSAEDRGTAQTSTDSQKPSAARQAGTSLLKKASALFFGVTPNANARSRPAGRNARGAVPVGRTVKMKATPHPWPPTCFPGEAS